MSEGQPSLGFLEDVRSYPFAHRERYGIWLLVLPFQAVSGDGAITRIPVEVVLCLKGNLIVSHLFSKMFFFSGNSSHNSIGYENLFWEP